MARINNVKIPEECTFEIEGNNLVVKGPKGESSREISDRSISISQKDGELVIKHEKTGKKAKKMVNSLKAHVKNMIKGVNEGFEYKLKVCSGHFPMNVSKKGNQLEVKNFIGEAVPRKLDLPNDVNVKVQGEDIHVDGINKERVGQVAASIEDLTKRRGFDKRIFQDGIYIVEKDGRKLV